jgi:hypothetical protein
LIDPRSCTRESHVRIAGIGARWIVQTLLAFFRRNLALLDNGVN